MKPKNSSNKENKECPLSRKNSRKLNKESYKITKNSPLKTHQSRVIYSLPQRVTNATAPQNFKALDQRLTGNGQPTAASEVSPAARLASTERTTPKKKEKPSWSYEDDDMMRMLDNGVQMSRVRGILSPEPARLPPLSPQIFSPITWPATPTDAFSQIFPPGTWTPERLQQRRIGVVSPALGPQSQTVLSHNNVLHENNAFTDLSEFLSPEAGLPQSPESPPIQFNSFGYN